jgi:hypothetical protein
MNALSLARCVVGSALFAIGVCDLQSSLERWARQRHVND